MRKRRTKREKPEEDQRRARVLFPSSLGGSVRRWRVSVGQNVEIGDVMAECLCKSADGGNPKVVDLQAPLDGTVKEIFFETGVAVPAAASGEAATVLRMTYCDHPIVVCGGLCGLCGRKPSLINKTALGEGAVQTGIIENQSPEQGISASMTLNVDGGNKILVSRDEAEGDHLRTMKRLIRNRKLLLVLDIDHTMLHATDDARAPAFVKSKGLPSKLLHRFMLDMSKEGVPGGEREHFVMLRPGLEQWLRQISKMYELYIYTAGTRLYAEAVARIFDPDKSLFGDRIISRTDVPELGKIKRLQRFFPTEDRMVIAVDDRSDVWLEDVNNLVTIRPYHFFLGMSEVNNASGPEFDLAEEIKEEVEAAAKQKMDRGLKRVLELLHWVHAHFYRGEGEPSLEQQRSGRGSDVKKLLRDLRRRILRGTPVVIDIPEPDRRAVWALAENAGAKCQARLTPETRAVISWSPNSPVAQEAKSKQVWVVHSDWLHACIHNWNREQFAHYSLFRVYDAKPGAKALAPAGGESAAASGEPPAGQSPEAGPSASTPRDVSSFSPAAATPEEKAQVLASPSSASASASASAASSPGKRKLVDVEYDEWGYPIEDDTYETTVPEAPPAKVAKSAPSPIAATGAGSAKSAAAPGDEDDEDDDEDDEGDASALQGFKASLLN